MSPIISVSRLTKTYDSGFHDNTLQASASLDWALGRTLDFLLRYDHRKQSASLATSEFNENRIGLYAAWWPLGRSHQ